MSAPVASTIAATTSRMASRRTTTRRWSTTIHYSSSHASSSNDSRERILPRKIVSFLLLFNRSNLRNYPLFSSANTSISHTSYFHFDIVENGTQYIESETARTAFLADGYRLQMNIEDDKVYCLKGDQSGKWRGRSWESCLAI